MAEWKKVIVSGSDAELNHLVVDTQVSASLFSGSFVGDGSGLTGLDVAINSYTNPADNRIITSVNSTTVNAESNLLFDGTHLGVTGSFGVSGETILGANGTDSTTISGTTINVPNIAAGTDNTVVVYNGSTLVTDEIDPKVWGTDIVSKNTFGLTGELTFVDSGTGVISSTNKLVFSSGPDSFSIETINIDVPNIAAGTDNSVVVYNGSSLVTDEIDSRVWGTTLLDNNGTPLTSGRVPYATDGDSLIDSSNLTFNGTTLVANAATITTNLLVSGDLTVVGTASFQHTDSLTVADRFILLASGSNSTGMGGLVVQQATQDIGEVFSWDNTTSRWATTGSFNATLNTFTPEAFMSSVIDVDGGNIDIAKYQKNGNIKVDSGEIYIYA
jgi:microcompartment protein CcmK/EutM